MKAKFKPDIMKKSLKTAFATALCAVFALTLTFCGTKTETVETADTTVVEPTPVDTTAADTTVVDTTAVN